MSLDRKDNEGWEHMIRKCRQNARESHHLMLPDTECSFIIGIWMHGISLSPESDCSKLSSSGTMWRRIPAIRPELPRRPFSKARLGDRRNEAFPERIITS